MTLKRQNVLVVHGLRNNGRSTIEHVVKSFAGFETTHDTLFASVFGEGPKSDLSFDVMVVTAEVLALRSSLSWRVFETRLKNWRSKSRRLILMPQDEYTNSLALELIANRLYADVIFGPCANYYERLLPRLSTSIQKEPMLPGYRSPYLVDATHNFVKNVDERTFDVVQRVSGLGRQFGSAGTLKADYALLVNALAQEAGLRTDISTKIADTFSGESWFDFLANGRWTPTTKGGSSINDRTGAIAFLVSCSQPRLRRGKRRFEKLMRTVDESDTPYVSDSPRIFEAACLGVGLIMPTDCYVGDLLPDEDYLAVETKNGDNSHAVVSKMKDRSYLRSMTQSAYQKLILNPKLSQEYATAKVIGAVPSEFQNSSEFKSVESDRQLSLLFKLESQSRRYEVRNQILSHWVEHARFQSLNALSENERQIVDYWLAALKNGLPIESISAKWTIPA